MIYQFFLIERDSRIKEMQERQTKLETNNKQLQVEEQSLREKVDRVSSQSLVFVQVHFMLIWWLQFFVTNKMFY